MASIRKRAKSSFYYACITLPGGKQRQFSTGLSDPDEALAAAVAAERAARKHHQRPHQLRAALDRLADEMTPMVEVDPAKWILAWAESRKREVGGMTLKAYQHTAKQAATFFTENGITTFSAITRGRLLLLRDTWAEHTSAVTVNTKLRHLAAAFAAALAEGRISENLAANIPPLREAQTMRREFRPAELALIIPHLTGEWRAMFFLGLYTGQRLNDLAVLRWSSLDLAAKTITLTTGKTKALVSLPLHQSALDALLELPAGDKPDAFVFPKLAATPKGTRSNQFRATLATVGLARPVKTKETGKDGPRITSELSFHSLRHTATSMLKAAGVSDAIARAFIGHESAAVSRSYTHLDMDTMRKALEKMPTV